MLLKSNKSAIKPRIMYSTHFTIFMGFLIYFCHYYIYMYSLLRCFAKIKKSLKSEIGNDTNQYYKEILQYKTKKKIIRINNPPQTGHQDKKIKDLNIVLLYFLTLVYCKECKPFAMARISLCV